MTEEQDLTKIEIEEPTGEDSPVVSGVELAEEEAQPERHSPKWSEYVLRQFEDDEIIDGNPTTEGMRRVIEKVLGTIIYSKPSIIQPPNLSNDYHAVVEWTIKVWSNGHIEEYGDVADFGRYNAPPVKEGFIDFSKWASATAATKAEGRAFRKALKLKRVVAAEEGGETDNNPNNNITDGQINFINMMCQRNNMNVMKMVNLSKKNQYSKIEDVPYATAVQISKFLSECQNGKRKVPEGTVGYDPDWRT